MKITCLYCGKFVSTELPDETVFRAIAICPECVSDDRDVSHKPIVSMEQWAKNLADKIKAAIAQKEHKEI